MTPRIKILIVICVGVYIGLSLYHWRQVKNLPDGDQRSRVSSVLKGNDHETNWIQVTTEPAQPPKKEDLEILAETNEPAEQKEAGSPAPDKDFTEETASSPELESEETTYQKLQITLQQQKDLNLQQKEKIKEQFAQILSLQASLDELKEQNQATEAVSEEHVDLVAANKKIAGLKRLLQSKIDAMDEANRRISQLAERLDQVRLTLVESENTNAHLQTVLADAETKKIEAEKKAETYLIELQETRNEKEKYLSETGRLHTELQQTRTRLSYIENELSKVQRQAAAMYRFGQEQDELITPFRQQIEVLNARVADKDRELLEAEDVSNIILDQKKDLQDKVEGLRQELQSKDERIAQLKNDAQALTQEREKTSELASQLEALVAQLNERDTRATTLQTELTELQSTADKLHQENELLQEKNEELNEAVTQVQHNLSATREQLVAEKDSQGTIEAELQKLKTEKQELLEQLTAQKQQLEKIKAVSLQKQKLPSKTAQQRAKDPTKQVEQNSQLAQAEIKIKQLQLAVQEAKKKSQHASAEIEQLTQALATAQQQLEDSEKTKTLRSELQLLQATIAEKENQHEAMQKRLLDMETENTSLQEQLQTAQEDSKLQDELEKKALELGNELTAKQESLTALEQKKAALKTELDRRESDFFALQEQYSLLQNKFATLQAERDDFFLYTLDSDNDSVPDAIDVCPATVAGAHAGPDGCEMDADGDTIVDRLDLCPDSQEKSDINVFGCTPGAPIILSGLYFSGGNTELSPASKEYLDSITPALLSAEDFRFEVGGHTDSIGDYERNQQVSQLRAEAVRDYLVSKGISEERLETVGYGSAQPVEDNATAEGRAVNRRVELKILSSMDQQSKAETLLPMTAGGEEGSPGQSENQVTPQTD